MTDRFYVCLGCSLQLDNGPPPYGDEWTPDRTDHNVVIRGPEDEHNGDAECGPVVEVFSQRQGEIVSDRAWQRRRDEL